MNKLFRPLFALLLLIPVALILVLQTVAAPQANEDQGIERRRRLLEQQAERLERAVENAIESDDPEAIQVRRNLHNQLKAIHLKLDELALFSDDNRERDEEGRRRGDDDDGRERDEERRRRGDDDDGRDNREREKHLSAALEHLQAAGLSREVARHVIGEVLRIQEAHKHQERDHRREDQREREHGDHEHGDGDHEHDDDERRRDDDDEDDERRRRDRDDDERQRDRDEDDDERRWLSPRTEEKILDALDDETVMEFADVPLNQMVDQIVNRHKIPVWIDEQSLDEIGMGTDTAVNQNLRGISLRSGLNLTLGSLRLAYVIKDEVLKITTPEQAEADLTSRIYPLGDLILPRDEHEASFATRIGAAVAAGRISREEAGKIFERHDRQEKHPQRNLHGDEQDREEHLQAAIEHLQGAGFSARTARHIIAEAMQLEDKDDDRHDDHHEVERRRHAEEDEHHHREREGDDEDEFHDRAHHQTATQLEALRREVAELRELVERIRNRR